MEIINLAIEEMRLLKLEFQAVKQEIMHGKDITPLCYKSLLLRMAVLDNSYKFVERMVLRDLANLPIELFLPLNSIEP